MIDSDSFFAQYLSPKSKQPRNSSSSDNRPFNLTAAQIRLSPPCQKEIKQIDSSRVSFLKIEQTVRFDKGRSGSHAMGQFQAFLKSSYDIADLLEGHVPNCTAQFAIRKFKLDAENIQECMGSLDIPEGHQRKFNKENESLKVQVKDLEQKNHSRKVCLKKMHTLLQVKEDQLVKQAIDWDLYYSIIESLSKDERFSTHLAQYGVETNTLEMIQQELDSLLEGKNLQSEILQLKQKVSEAKVKLSEILEIPQQQTKWHIIFIKCENLIQQVKDLNNQIVEYDIIIVSAKQSHKQLQDNLNTDIRQISGERDKFKLDFEGQQSEYQIQNDQLLNEIKILNQQIEQNIDKNDQMMLNKLEQIVELNQQYEFLQADYEDLKENNSNLKDHTHLISIQQEEQHRELLIQYHQKEQQLEDDYKARSDQEAKEIKNELIIKLQQSETLLRESHQNQQSQFINSENLVQKVKDLNTQILEQESQKVVYKQSQKQLQDNFDTNIRQISEERDKIKLDFQRQQSEFQIQNGQLLNEIEILNLQIKQNIDKNDQMMLNKLEQIVELNQQYELLQADYEDLKESNSNLKDHTHSRSVLQEEQHRELLIQYHQKEQQLEDDYKARSDQEAKEIKNEWIIKLQQSETLLKESHINIQYMKENFNTDLRQIIEERDQLELHSKGQQSEFQIQNEQLLNKIQILNQQIEQNNLKHDQMMFNKLEQTVELNQQYKFLLADYEDLKQQKLDNQQSQSQQVEEYNLAISKFMTNLEEAKSDNQKLQSNVIFMKEQLLKQVEDSHSQVQLFQLETLVQNETQKLYDEQQKEIYNLQTHMNYYSNANKSLQILCDQYTQQLAEKEEDLFTQYNNVTRLEEELEINVNQQLQTKIKSNELEVKYDTASEKCGNLESILFKNQSELEKIKKQQESKEQDIKSFQDSSKQMVQINESMQFTIETQTKKLNKFDCDYKEKENQFNEEIVSMRRQIAILTNENTQTIHSKNQTQESLDELNKIFTKKKRDMKVLLKEKQLLMQDISNLQSMNTSIDEKNEHFKGQITFYLKDLDEQRRVICQNKEEVANLTNDQKIQDIKLSDQQNQISLLQEKNNHLELDLSHSQSEVDTVNMTDKHLNEEIHQIKNKLEQVVMQYNSLQLEKQTLLNLNQEFSDQVLNLSCCKQESENQINLIKIDNSDLNNQLKNLSEHNSLLEEQKSQNHTSEHQKINSLKSKLKQSEYEYKMVQAAIKQQEEKTNETLFQYKKKIQDLNSKIQDLHNQVRLQQTELGGAQFLQEDISIKLQIYEMKNTALRTLAISIVKYLDPKIKESSDLSLEDYMELAIKKASLLRKINKNKDKENINSSNSKSISQSIDLNKKSDFDCPFNDEDLSDIHLN